jgi:thiamine biosynthesis lipoprotein
MGTVFSVTVVADDQATARRLADAAVREARRWDDILTTWRVNGELSRLNARAGSGPCPISHDLARALAEMQRLAKLTLGAFDPAVAPLSLLWREITPPTAPSRDRHPPYRIAQVLTLTGETASLAPGASLDAGGIGKGIALDAIASVLRRGGARAAFLDFGGSSQLALGDPPGGPPGWQVLVSGLEPGSVRGVITLLDQALATSRALGPGADAGPIIDPRSGRPVPPPRLVTVLAPNATSADAWSTALIVLGRNGLPLLAAEDLDAFMEDGDGMTLTSGFRVRQPAGGGSSEGQDFLLDNDFQHRYSRPR